MQRQWKRLTWVVSGFVASLVATPALSLVTSVGESGIDARRLQQAPYNLTGSKIAIGQVEIGRPAFFGLDKAAGTNPSVRPGGVFSATIQPLRMTMSMVTLETLPASWSAPTNICAV